VEASLAHRPLAPGIWRRVLLSLLHALETCAMETLLAIELGQAGVQDIEALQLLEDRLHQLDGSIRLLLVVGHGGEGLRNMWRRWARVLVEGYGGGVGI